jgi:FtsZ-binding cell division protein ZapB
MKKLTLTYLIVLGLATLLFAAVSNAQSPEQIDRLRQELERTDDIIEQAREAFRSTDAPMAGLPLQKAIDLQRRAWMNFKNKRYALAFKLTMEARELAKKAMVRSRMIEQGETVVLRRLEQAGELLERARDAMPAGPEGKLWALYESAKDNLSRAWEFYRESRYRVALKLANQVVKAAREILNVSNLRFRQETEFERRLEAVGEVIDRAKDKAAGCGSEAAQRLLDQAIKSYQLSKDLAAKKNYQAALQNLRKARCLAMEVAKKCDGTEGLSRRYERLKSEADAWNERIPPDNDLARKLIRQAYEQLELAQTYIAQNRTEAAAAALKAAQLALNQLKRHLGGGL